VTVLYNHKGYLRTYTPNTLLNDCAVATFVVKTLETTPRSGDDDYFVCVDRKALNENVSS
jgi:hypothetical protein